jgi:ankyrin repeat protein
MKRLPLLVILAIAAPLLVGCGATADPGATPSVSDTAAAPALIFDPEAPLTPQMEAAIDANDAVLAEEVLNAGFDTATDLDGEITALHRAAARDASAVIPVLVAAGADLEARSARRTPLMLAAMSGGPETVVALLDAGADPLAGDPGYFGATPIHFAAQVGKVEIVDTLITWGVDVDHKDTSNSTALIYAAFFGQLEVARYLLEAGADVDWRDNFGDTPLNACDQVEFPELAALLIDAGGHI